MLDVERLRDDFNSKFGADSMVTSEAVLDHWKRATMLWSATPLAVVRPGSAEACAGALRYLSEFRVAVQPVSRGRAWGMGSRLPFCNSVMLDLSKLNRILDLDLVAGTARIEPGVTFRQLDAALQKTAAEFEVPFFGGPPDASVLANALDRGDGMGRFGDRFSQLWDLDVVLMTGERLRTGWGRHGADELERLHARPAGPLLEGLFSQSGFGCVVSGRIALAPVLSLKRHVVVEIGPVNQIGPILDTLRSLMATGVVAAHEFYLWDGAKRLSSQFIAAEIEDAELPIAFDDWAMSLTLSAAHVALLEAKTDIVTAAIADLGLAHEWDSGNGDVGMPTEHRTDRSDGRNLTSCYWAKPSLPDADLDPDRDGCGFLWLCPALPFTSAAVQQLDRTLQEIRSSHDIFATVGCEAVSHRALQCYLSLAWDRDQPGADERAMRAHDDLHAALAIKRWLPYRHTLASLRLRSDVLGDWAAVTERIKHALDPHDQLARGRVLRAEPFRR